MTFLGYLYSISGTFQSIENKLQTIQGTLNAMATKLENVLSVARKQNNDLGTISDKVETLQTKLLNTPPDESETVSQIMDELTKAQASEAALLAKLTAPAPQTTATTDTATTDTQVKP